MCDIYDPDETQDQTDAAEDARLVTLAQGGDMNALEALLYKYTPLAYAACRDRFLPGADADDLIQEGMIAILSAVKSFVDDGRSSFANFAAMCVKRRIDTAVKNANRKKHAPLNSYLSLQTGAGEEDGSSLEEELLVSGGDGKEPSPEEILLREEEEERLYRQLESLLSSMEMKVLAGLLDGLSYSEISERLGMNEKAVDNARQRIKSKLLKNRFYEILS